ncbi:MAG: LPXTG cell wall anchor domain-containing protein, partial [Peptostreptococcaceae bacterium]|nr:LPXTG cell wall anchor domain-containing protein [Peptostreptococcaceae bacterium]
APPLPPPPVTPPPNPTEHPVSPPRVTPLTDPNDPPVTPGPGAGPSPDRPERDVEDPPRYPSLPFTPPINDVPNVNPPIDVPFRPNVITNTDNLPPVENPVLTIINEENVPLGNAVVDPANQVYTFIDEEKTPLGVAQIHKDNTLEVLNEQVAKGVPLPKTGRADKSKVFYLGGLAVILLGVVVGRKKREKK